ncbi:hypothetical protein [Streptomyces sp. NPDC057616]|uniref:hypothetical protein n=1 Tax=Streptomyces sp. NPDC057616 TaxID=3346183 RepID=UPI00369289E2
MAADVGVDGAGRSAGRAGVEGAAARWRVGFAVDVGVDGAERSAGVVAGAEGDAARWTAGDVVDAAGDEVVLVEPGRVAEGFGFGPADWDSGFVDAVPGAVAELRCTATGCEAIGAPRPGRGLGPVALRWTGGVAAREVDAGRGVVASVDVTG